MVNLMWCAKCGGCNVTSVMLSFHCLHNAMCFKCGLFNMVCGMVMWSECGMLNVVCVMWPVWCAVARIVRCFLCGGDFILYDTYCFAT